jgi:cytidyltransferase-like protein
MSQQQPQQFYTVCVSGYFNPLTVGHLEYFALAKEEAAKRAEALGRQARLLVIVNSDAQSVLKKGYTFMPESERVRIVSSIRCVDQVVLSIDTDRTVRATLAMLMDCSETINNINAINAIPLDAFANGGDQFNHSIPEADVCGRFGIELMDGLGDKIQSSSWLIEGALMHASAVAAQK